MTVGLSCLRVYGDIKSWIPIVRVSSGLRFIWFLVEGVDPHPLNLDKLIYACALISLARLMGNSRYQFVQGDVFDQREHLGDIKSKYGVYA